MHIVVSLFVYHSNLKRHEIKFLSIFYFWHHFNDCACLALCALCVCMQMHVVCLHVKDTYTCMCYTCLSVCLSVCSQVDVSPVTALNLLLELPPNTVNNTQRLPLLTRAFTTAQSNGTANKLLLEVCNNMLECVICV